MSTPVLYRSSDASAPVLTGNAGSLVTVLDACLVNGYGSKAAAGWAKSFSGTNAADYKQPAGCGFYLDVADNSPNGTSLGKEAAIRGYEAMTAIATGTNPFPTTGQAAAPGLRVRKSSATGASAISWFVIADDRTVFMGALTGDTAGCYSTWGFGDYYGFKSADAYKCFIKAGSAMNTAAGTNGDLPSCTAANTSVGQAGMFMARGNAGTAGALGMNQLGYGTTGALNVPAPYPNPSDSSLYLARYLLVEPTSADVRGYMRGFWQLMNMGGLTMADKDTFSGTGDLAGRTFVVVGKDALNVGYMVFETTAWDTST